MKEQYNFIIIAVIIIHLYNITSRKLHIETVFSSMVINLTSITIMNVRMNITRLSIYFTVVSVIELNIPYISSLDNVTEDASVHSQLLY